MGTRQSALLAVGFLVCLLAGCADVRDVSEQARYPKYIGTTDKLCRECELWKDGKASSKYVILVPTVPLASFGIEHHAYAMLPEGTPVHIEAIQQEDDKNGHPYDYAVVTLDDPKHPNHRIHAGVRFEFLQEMSKLGK
jgi:hypothetical protein